MRTEETAVDGLVEDSRRVLVGMRRALIELYASVGADPGAPQEVARRLGLNRNLTWKLSRVINSPDPFAMLNHLPGQQGFELATTAFGRAGAPAEVVTQVTAAVNEFGEVVRVHAGDRTQLELTLESTGLFEREVGVEGGRELAYRGNAMIWGVQARTRLVVNFMAPAERDAAPGGVTVAQVGGLVAFRRLRPTARWRLFRLQMHDDSGARLQRVVGPEELLPKSVDDTPLVLREFCSPNMPAVECADGPEGREYLLPAGPVGNQGAFDCFFGYVARGIPRYRCPGNECGSIAVSLTLPAETVIMDLIVHRDLRIDQPEALLYGFPHGGLDSPAAQSVQNLLPFTAKVEELAGMPPAVSTPLVPRYNQLVARVYERMNWKPAEFRGLRVRMEFPPMSTRLVLRWPLADPPDGAAGS